MTAPKKYLLISSVVIAFLVAVYIFGPTERTITIRGKILSNQFDSGIDDGNYSGILFWNDSTEGRAILAVCKNEELCEITGTINTKGKIKEFLSVSKVEKLDVPKK